METASTSAAHNSANFSGPPNESLLPPKAESSKRGVLVFQ